LTFLGGVRITDAHGYILQLNEHFDTVRYDTAAFGAGPMFMVRWEPIRARVASVSLDAVGGVVLYDARFPAGGDIYDFTFRFGGAVAVTMTPRTAIGAGVRWMHLSNGQGLGPQNPSYEGVGFHLGVTFRL
jgi:hypothetical protein